MNAIACSTGTESVSGSSMMSVFCGLKPGRMPTTMPSRIAGQITHHSAELLRELLARNSQVIYYESAQSTHLDRPVRDVGLEQRR